MTTFVSDTIHEFFPYLDATTAEWGFAPEIKLSHVEKARLSLHRHPHGVATFFINPTPRDIQHPKSVVDRIMATIALGNRWRRIRTFPQESTFLAWPAHHDFLKALELEFKRTTLWSFSTTPILELSAKFNLDGFSHDARRFIIRLGDGRPSISPAKVAREIFQEIVDHRQTCNRCGKGISPLRVRVAGILKDGPGLDVPPDALERMTRPRLSRQLEKRISMLGGTP